MIVALPELSSDSLRQIIRGTSQQYLLLTDPRFDIDISQEAIDRFMDVARSSHASLVFSDSVGLPRIDYQEGSVRDTFDFGALFAVDCSAAAEVLSHESRWSSAGLYELRLGLARKGRVVRIPEPLYAQSARDTRAEHGHFAYVDPRNRDYQLEMEAVATAHLKQIEAYLPASFEEPPIDREYRWKASVIIPVRNREGTILDAVQSALRQQCDSPVNVIVVDNHSTDGTTGLLRSVSDERLFVLEPSRRDLGIGGCWNLAVRSEHCGRFAIQLDSDDLYVNGAVQRILDCFASGPFAMVVGAYSLVDFDLRPIPPGLIDHREWTRENGRNNLLRVNGIGAPRAYQTSVIRAVGFPNVSYGEDYAVSLAISRRFEVGRIFDSLYLCRRWEGNSDSALPREQANRYDSYKDWLRTTEIHARRSHVRQS